MVNTKRVHEPTHGTLDTNAAATPPTWARVQAICDWVHHNITFQMGTSTPTTTAANVYESRIGVCRDFALLSVAFCRALNIPARYGFGYLPDMDVVPPDAPIWPISARIMSLVVTCGESVPV